MRTQNHFNRRGIDLDTPSHWVIDEVGYPTLFFKHLSTLSPAGSILYFEGTKIAPALAELYMAHRATNALPIVQETVVPIPQMYHCTVSEELFRSLAQMAAGRPAADLFNYLKGYRDGRLLFTWNEAYEGELRITDHLPENLRERFCQAMGVECRREKTTAPKPEALERFSLLKRSEGEEQEEEETTPGNPWYQRAWTWLTHE